MMMLQSRRTRRMQRDATAVLSSEAGVGSGGTGKARLYVVDLSLGADAKATALKERTHRLKFAISLALPSRTREG